MTMAQLQHPYHGEHYPAGPGMDLTPVPVTYGAKVLCKYLSQSSDVTVNIPPSGYYRMDKIHLEENVGVEVGGIATATSVLNPLETRLLLHLAHRFARNGYQALVDPDPTGDHIIPESYHTTPRRSGFIVYTPAETLMSADDDTALNGATTPDTWLRDRDLVVSLIGSDGKERSTETAMHAASHLIMNRMSIDSCIINGRRRRTSDTLRTYTLSAALSLGATGMLAAADIPYEQYKDEMTHLVGPMMPETFLRTGVMFGQYAYVPYFTVKQEYYEALAAGNVPDLPPVLTPAYSSPSVANAMR